MHQLSIFYTFDTSTCSIGQKTNHMCNIFFQLGFFIILYVVWENKSKKERDRVKNILPLFWILQGQNQKKIHIYMTCIYNTHLLNTYMLNSSIYSIYTQKRHIHINTAFCFFTCIASYVLASAMLQKSYNHPVCESYTRDINFASRLYI